LISSRPATLDDWVGSPCVNLTFREIFDAHYDYVWHSLRRLGIHPADLDDLAAEVFTRVHASLASYDERRPMRPWLFAFVFRLAAGYRRLARHRREVGTDDYLDLADDAPSPEEAAIVRQEQELVQRALSSITLHTRAVFVLYEIDGATMKEIAEALDIPVNTAYSRLRLARAAFETKVRELRGETVSRYA
jgi:RNA polymerase sigma-70 factor (ECF subfamily)